MSSLLQETVGFVQLTLGREGRVERLVFRIEDLRDDFGTRSSELGI